MTRRLVRVPAGKDHVLGGREAPLLPIFIDSETGEPHRSLNAYLRYRFVTRRRSILTVRDKDASHISAFLNHLYLQTNPKDENWMDAWRLVTTDKMLHFQKVLKSDADSPSTRNQYLISIYQFYWFCEKNGYIEGVIGIADTAVNDKEYPLDVLSPPKGSTSQYKIPILERFSQKQRLDIGNAEDWDRALELASMDDSILGERDELMLRLVREGTCRREELANLDVTQFSPEATGEYKSFPLEVDKNSKGRAIKVNIELYRDVQDFIEYTRDEFISGKVDHGYLFIGMGREGMHLSDRYINQRFLKYGVKPHDGRSVGLTERIYQLIQDGMDKASIMMIVSQEAGHSLASKGQTLEKHYIQAEALAKGSVYEPIGLLKSKLVKQDAEIAELKDLVSKQQAYIAELEGKTSQIENSVL